jgi:hypothetical protein
MYCIGFRLLTAPHGVGSSSSRTAKRRIDSAADLFRGDQKCQTFPSLGEAPQSGGGFFAYHRPMTRFLPLLLVLTACGSGSGSDDDVAAGGTSGRASGGTGGTGGSSGGRGGTSGGTSGTSGTSGTGAADNGAYFGDAHSGNFWIGPVDYDETEWHNACAPTVKYPQGIRNLYGTYIMGLANEVVLDGLKASAGQLCDACVELTANGTTLIAHAVTYGQETGPNDIDVSPEADAALDGATSRDVTWRFITCPSAAPIQYTFDGRQWTNVYFFRVWPRNSRVPIAKVEYQIGSGAWSAVASQSDGAWQASGADFSGGFSLRLTTIDGQTLQDTLPGLNTFDPDVGVSSHGNF